MMDAQDVSALEKRGLVVYVQFKWKDFLYEGKGRPRFGYLSAEDRPHAEEPPGRMALAIYNYEMGRFPHSSMARLTLNTSNQTPELPPRIAVVVSGREATSFQPDVHTATYGMSFESRYLASGNNYIYFEPSFDDPPHGKSRLLTLESIEIVTY